MLECALLESGDDLENELEESELEKSELERMKQSEQTKENEQEK